MISNKNISTSHFTKLLKLQRFVSTWTYSRNNMGQKCEGNCGLWVLNEIIKKLPYVPPILGQLLDLIFLAITNLFEPRLESYNPYDIAN